MAMLEYNEITPRKFIIYENEPYEVLTSHVFRKQQRKPVNATKLKNLVTGRIVEPSFHVSDKVPEAEILTREVKYLYANRDQYWFCELNDATKRFSLTQDQVGDQGKFIKPNSNVSIIMFEETLLGVKAPIKVELKVVESSDAVKGNTVQGGSKLVKLETGAEVQVPMFIKQGDIIRVNSETGDYVERA
jgi:elongation factor P